MAVCHIQEQQEKDTAIAENEHLKMALASALQKLEHERRTARDNTDSKESMVRLCLSCAGPCVGWASALSCR